MRFKGLFLCALVVAGCGASRDHDDETDATLTISPATTELLILDGVPATQTYSATLTFPDGFTKDVTAETVFSIDSTFGTFQSATVAVITSGKTTAFGQRDEKVAAATIIARVQTTRVDPALPPGVPDLFDTLPEDTTRAPNVIYPPDNVVMPRNLGDFETHWTDASGNDVFEISLTTEYADIRVYVPGGNGNLAAGPMASFSAFLASEWLSAVGLQPNVRYRVRGLQLANPTSIGAGPTRNVDLSNERLEGGLYYWAAASTNGAEGIYRHDMNKPGQVAEQYLTTIQTTDATYPQGRCVACHVLSRDGTKMAITYEGGDRNATIVDVATAARQADFTAWNFATFTPDGSQLLTVFQGTLTVRSSNDQAALTTMAAAGPVSHPDLSPDGTRLVYVREPGGADWAFVSGQLYTRSYDQTTRTFGAEVPLLEDAANNHFYPSWSPDGQWILFNRSAATEDAYDNGNAQLFVIKADGTGTPIELTNANVASGLTNSWGRWAPFQQSIGINNEPIFWVTVSSRRDFGVRLFGLARPQIWMTPFFPEHAASASDPSTSAFRLPFQDIGSNNHIAQWTERVVTTQ
jgi:hypothetical protein